MARLIRITPVYSPTQFRIPMSHDSTRDSILHAVCEQFTTRTKYFAEWGLDLYNWLFAHWGNRSEMGTVPMYVTHAGDLDYVQVGDNIIPLAEADTVKSSDITSCLIDISKYSPHIIGKMSDELGVTSFRDNLSKYSLNQEYKYNTCACLRDIDNYDMRSALGFSKDSVTNIALVESLIQRKNLLGEIDTRVLYAGPAIKPNITYYDIDIATYAVLLLSATVPDFLMAYDFFYSGILTRIFEEGSSAIPSRVDWHGNVLNEITSDTIVKARDILNLFHLIGSDMIYRTFDIKPIRMCDRETELFRNYILDIADTLIMQRKIAAAQETLVSEGIPVVPSYANYASFTEAITALETYCDEHSEHIKSFITDKLLKDWHKSAKFTDMLNDAFSQHCIAVAAELTVTESNCVDVQLKLNNIASLVGMSVADLITRASKYRLENSSLLGITSCKNVHNAKDMIASLLHPPLHLFEPAVEISIHNWVLFNKVRVIEYFLGKHDDTAMDYFNSLLLTADSEMALNFMRQITGDSEPANAETQPDESTVL